MSSAHSLQKKWQDWLNQNLATQADPVYLYQTMRDNGFARAMIRDMMGAAFPKDAIPEPPADPYYLALCNPPLGKNTPELHVERFESPRLQLYSIENFMTEAECNVLIDLSESQLQPSVVDNGNGDLTFRTSSTCYFTETSNALVDELEERIARTLGISRAYSEQMQVQRYEVGQEFKAHHDYFLMGLDLYKTVAGDAGQRTWTFMVYLNNTPQGGGTEFTEIDHTFYPKQGMAVLWNNLNEDGSTNSFTVHRGMPVEEGSKIIITKWFREKGQGPMFYADTQQDVSSQPEVQPSQPKVRPGKSKKPVSQSKRQPTNRLTPG